ncbi:MAG: PAS domain-containing sensor histidine kinase [Promethearchaeota archaeon]
MGLISIYLMKSDVTIDKYSNVNKQTESFQELNIDSEENFQILLDCFPLSIILLDLNKKIYYCNKATELYLQKSSDNLLKKFFYDLFIITEERKLRIDEIIDNVISIDFSEVFELEFINQKGLKTWIELFFSSIKIKKKKFIQIILYDITEKKIVEKIIKDENLRLKEMNSIKKDMTAKTSEKLKTPLNIMANASEILIRDYRKFLDQEALNLLDLIKEGSENSLNLVGKIVNISETESDNLILNKKINNLTQVLIESINFVNEEFETYPVNFSLNISEDLYSTFDKLRMDKAFKDLLMNLLESNKVKDIIISARIDNNVGDIQVNCSLEQSIVPLTPIINSFSKKIFKLHNWEIVIDDNKIPQELCIKIQIPIKRWKDNLISLFIICKSGIPLFDYSFERSEKYRDSSLISGGIIGLMTILKAILQGDTHIKSIDHGDRTVIFDLNKSKEIIFVLIVKESFTIYERKLSSLIQEFDSTYMVLINDIDNSCNDIENWQDVGFLVKKYFVE